LGTASLLQKVTLMWKDGSYTNNAEGRGVLAQEGRYVLVTNDRLLNNFSGAVLRDGQQVGRRFSSTAFAFRDPIPMGSSGDFGVSNSVFGCTVPLDYQDPINPFKHKYHPDHDNLNDRFDLAVTNRLAEGRESFTVTRRILLQFTGADPDRLALPGWGDTQLGGIYRETITGLHKEPLNIEGTFRLHRASPVGVLNDGR
jgi:hypothetical protein